MNAFDLQLLMDQQEEHIGSLDEDEEQALAPDIERLIDDAITAVPMYARLATAGQRLIQTIHGVPELDTAWRRDRLEFYLGRAGATADHVFDRFEHHHGSKSHTAGIVVFRCSTDVVSLWEGAAIRVLKHLEARERLCVANVLRHGGGSLPSVDESVVYLTWRLLPRPQTISVPTRNDVQDIAVVVGEELRGEVSPATLERALDSLTRPKQDRADLYWAEGHDE